MIIPDNRYLEYFYNNMYYPSKWAAAQAAHLDGIRDNFLFSSIQATISRKHIFFSGLDTTQDPQESWDELLKERATRLRDSLPKIVIAFSGGADSFTMVNAFVQNGLHIDKIIVGNSYSLTKNDSMYYELENYAFPMLEYFDLKNTEIEIVNFETVSEWSQHVLDEELYWDEGYQILPTTGVSLMRTLHRYSDNQKIIRGVTEPRVYWCKKTSNWRAEMWDTDNWYNTGADHFTIPFFSDPHFPKLHLKQLHLTKNELKRLSLADSSFLLNPDPYKYKTAYQRVTRGDIPKQFNMTSSPFFIKNNVKEKDNVFKYDMYRKKLEFYKTLYKEEKKLTERIFSILDTKIGNTPIYNHKYGCRIFDIPLA